MTEEQQEYQQLRRDQNRREAAAASRISPFPGDHDYEDNWKRKMMMCSDGFCGADDCPRCRPSVSPLAYFE